LKLVAWMAHHLESRAIVDEYIARISEHMRGHEFVICEDVDSIKREIVDADVLICWRVTPEVFACATKLKWIQFGSAGIDHTIFAQLQTSEVTLTTMSGIHAIPVAEHVIGLMLAMTRRLDLAMKLQVERRYERDEIAATAAEMRGTTIGIVGLGKIGLSIARLARAFGMRVLGTKRTPAGDFEGVERVYEPDDLRKMLPHVDYLVLTVPLTASTHEFIRRGEIALMRQGSYLVNIARGAMVNHEALGDALASGKLAGAALDVFPEEPLPPDSPLYDFPNVILTPHTASSSESYAIRAADVFQRNFRAFVAGTTMVNVYDRKRGY
jgi:D-2-hydroxyacid dehydrogenase (NADP+)